MSDSLHILLVADGRSPITRRWISGLLELGWRVSLLSTYPCQAQEGVEALRVVPVAFGGYSGAQVDTLKTGAAPAKKQAARGRWSTASAAYSWLPATGWAR